MISSFFSFIAKTEIKKSDKIMKSKENSTTNETNNTSIIQLERNLFTKQNQENVVLSKSDSINDTSVLSNSGAGINPNLTPESETEFLPNKNESKFIPILPLE